MNSLNSVLIEGNLTSDPGTQDLTTDRLCTFAVESRRTGKEDGTDTTINEVNLIEIEAYKKTGELCARTLKNGNGVRVVGRLKQVRWHDTTGQECSKVVVVAELVEFKPKWDRKPTTTKATV